MKLLKKVPLPIAGLMLALAATGNLLGKYDTNYRVFFGIFGAIIFVLFTIKILTDWGSVQAELKNPIIASVVPTYSMGLMLLATYIQPSLSVMAFGVWLIGLVMHVLLMIYFTKSFVINFNIKNVFPSIFIVYVGIVVASVTALVFKALVIGKILFWFGFISYLLLLPLVLYRVFKVKNIPEPAQPTIAIFAAPASLCLAGYLSSFSAKNMLIVVFLTSLSAIMTLAVLAYLPKLLKHKFYPSYSAFTFPLVISAIAMQKASGLFTSSFVKYLAIAEEWIAILVVLYVLLRYFNFLFADILFQKKVKTAEGK